MGSGIGRGSGQWAGRGFRNAAHVIRKALYVIIIQNKKGRTGGRAGGRAGEILVNRGEGKEFFALAAAAAAALQC